MHDLDRAMFETDEVGQQQGEQQEFLQVLGGLLRGGEHGRGVGDGRRMIDRATQEAELATELLEAHETGETERFIGSLLSRVGGVAQDFARSDTGQALGGILKKAAGEALPVIGRGIGGYFGSQYAGIGEQIGRGAGTVLGLELEGLSQEDREFESAKTFIRFADAAVRRAAQAPPGAAPLAVARSAATAAAQRFAPGLLAVLGQAIPGGGAHGHIPGAVGGRRLRGQWVRRGDHIVILGA